MTPDEATARGIIRNCDEVWNRVCYIDQVTHDALVTAIARALREQRERDAKVLDDRATIKDKQAAEAHRKMELEAAVAYRTWAQQIRDDAAAIRQQGKLK